MRLPLVFMEKKHETKPGIARETTGNSEVLPQLWGCSFLLLPDDGSNTLTYNTRTPHTVQATTFRMGSHLLLEKNGESNKRKKERLLWSG